jgi:hypothetical protein
MKIWFFILFSIATSTNLFAQKTKGDTANLELHCGWAAFTCPEIIAYKKMVAVKNFDLIKSKLTNGTLTEKVLSAMVIEKLQQGNLFSLTAAEEKAYTSLITSKLRVEACYTCIWHFKGTIKEFFHPKKEGGMTELTPFGVIRDELFSN